MELLPGLRADLPSKAPTVLPLTTPARQSTHAKPSLSRMSWLVALTLLVALGATYHFLQVANHQIDQLMAVATDHDRELIEADQQIRTLNTQLAAQSPAATAAQRERMYVLTGNRPPFMTSRGEHGVASLALAYRDKGARGIENLSPDEQAARTAEIDSALDQAAGYLSALPDRPA